MRNIQAGFIVVLILTAVARAETAPPNKPKANDAPLAQNPVWRERINRLRDQPFAGEIINGSPDGRCPAANVTSVYEFKDEDKAKAALLQEAYGAELLKRASKWEEELNALRAEYETKIAALLPEGKRESFRKVLEYSHSRWTADYNYDLEISQGVQPLPEKPTAEQQQVRAANIAWIKQQRDKQKLERAETLKNILALLTQDEAARLEKAGKPQK